MSEASPSFMQTKPDFTPPSDSESFRKGYANINPPQGPEQQPPLGTVDISPESAFMIGQAVASQLFRPSAGPEYGQDRPVPAERREIEVSDILDRLKNDPSVIAAGQGPATREKGKDGKPKNYILEWKKEEPGPENNWRGGHYEQKLDSSPRESLKRPDSILISPARATERFPINVARWLGLRSERKMINTWQEGISRGTHDLDRLDKPTSKRKRRRNDQEARSLPQPTPELDPDTPIPEIRPLFLGLRRVVNERLLARNEQRIHKRGRRSLTATQVQKARGTNPKQPVDQSAIPIFANRRDTLMATALGGLYGHGDILRAYQFNAERHQPRVARRRERHIDRIHRAADSTVTRQQRKEHSLRARRQQLLAKREGYQRASEQQIQDLNLKQRESARQRIATKKVLRESQTMSKGVRMLAIDPFARPELAFRRARAAVRQRHINRLRRNVD